MLFRSGYQASFYVVGEKALKHPEIIQEIVKRGHAVENHSHRHANGFAFYGSRRLQEEIETAQNTIAEIAGTPPRFFRAPMGLRTPFLDPVLARLGLHYSTWTRRGFDSVANDVAPVLQRLTNGLVAGDILLLHDGSMLATRKTKPIVLDVLPNLLTKISEAGLKPVTMRHACRDVLGD